MCMTLAAKEWLVQLLDFLAHHEPVNNSKVYGVSFILRVTVFYSTTPLLLIPLEQFVHETQVGLDDNIEPPHTHI